MKNGQSNEYTAKTVEAAVEEGLRDMGVSRDQIEVEVVQEGSRGILGIGATDAQVRLKPKAESAEADVEQQEESGSADAIEADEIVEAEEAAEIEASTETEETVAAVEDASVAVDEQLSVSEDDASTEFEGEEDDDDADLEDLSFDLLSQMLQHLDIEAEIELSWLEDEEDGDRPLCLNVVGDDLGLLIGRNGETLSSIQYLIRLMVNQELHRWKNIVIDIDGYKERRAEQLEQLAQRMAEQVVASGRPASLEPMPANERRLVHIALRNHEHVYTSSTGEDYRRKVQILLR
ncbi:MAG: Jag N-terminal domain-containing protein [Caldilineaceae bacterium]|nr:Jag N-terminal domain-containing protein [Caldilineaceae bacterium]